MIKIDDSKEDISNFFQTLAKLKKKERLPLHEPTFNKQDIFYTNKALRSSQVSTYGKFTKMFENKIQSFCKANYTFSTINGSAALHISLILSGVDEKSEVLLSTLGFVSSVNSVAHLRAKPIFCDCEGSTLGIDPAKLKKFLKQYCVVKKNKCFNNKSKKFIKAAILTHVFGNPCQIIDLCKILREYKIKIIEDAAECLGSRYKKKHLGTFGDYGVLSFNGNKIITTGGGGAVLLKKLIDYKKGINLIGNMKIKHPYEQEFADIGYNYRLPSINSALGLSQLTKINTYLRKKKHLQKFYQKEFKNLKNFSFFNSLNSGKSNNWLNAILIKKNHKHLRKILLEKSIKLGVELRPVWKLLHKMKRFKNCQKTDLKNALDLENRIITLPSSHNIISKL